MANINLARLDLDVKTLIQKMYETSDSIKYMREQQKLLMQQAARLNPELQKDREQLERIGLQYERNRVQIARQSETYRALTAAARTQTQANGQLLTQQQAVNVQVDKLNTSEAEYLQNNKELIALRKQLTIPTQALYDTQEEYNAALEEYQKNLTAINKKLDENNAFIRENVSQYEQQKINIGNYREDVRGAFDDINIFNGGLSGFIARSQQAGGAGVLLATSFRTITTGILGMTKAALAFIATPIGATIAALATIAIATKEWAEYNIEAAKANRVTEAITKLSGDNLNRARVDSKAMEKIFNVDYKKILESAQAYVKEYGVSFDEAMSMVEDGLVKSGPYAEEYLEIVKEFPKVLSNAGFSMQDFQALANTGIDTQLFDKLPDAVKEFTQAITEQTPAAREALENAFGEEFTNNLLKNLKDGTISVKDALIEVSSETKRLGLNSQQAQQLTADLFKGIGEDAGGAIKILDAVTQSLEEQQKPLSELDKSVKSLVDSEMALAEAQDLALNSEGFERWKNEAMIALNSVTQAFYEAITAMFNTREELELLHMNRSQARIIKQNNEDAIKEFDRYIKRVKELAGDDFNMEDSTKRYIDNLNQSLKRAIEEGDKFEQQMLESEIATLENHTRQKIAVINKNGLEEAKARAEAAQTALDAYAEKIKLDTDLFLSLQDEKSKSYEKELADAQYVKTQKIKLAAAEYEASKKTENDKLKMRIAINQATNEYIAAQNEATLKEAEKLYKAEIEAAGERLDSNKNLTEQMYNNELARMEKTLEAEKKFLEEKFNLNLLTQQELNAELQKLDRENIQAKEKLTDDYNKSKYDKQLLDIENQKIINEGNFLQEMELEKQRLELLKEQELSNKNLTEQQKLEIIEKYDKLGRDIDEKIADFKIDQQKKIFGSLAAIMGQQSKAGKAFAIAQTTIDTYQAAQKAYLSQLTLDPTSPIRAALAAAVAVAVGLRNVQMIAGVKNPKFRKGGVLSMIGGKRHSAGGTKFMGEDGTSFEAEQGELIGVMNRNAAQHFMAFNNAYPADGMPARPNTFQSGGIVNTSVQGFDYDMLAEKLAVRFGQEVQNLPAPVVTVTDIVNETSKTVMVQDMAKF